MKIYVAGSFGDQKPLRDEAHKLWSLGHEVVSSWLSETAPNPLLSGPAFMRKLAIKDIAEVSKADLIIMDNRQISGGKNCEWGIAVDQHQSKVLWLIGEPNTVFHYLADRTFADWDAVLKCLTEEK